MNNLELNTKREVRPTLREMNIGDRVSFPMSRMSVIRTVAYTLGVEMERKYKATLNKLSKSIDVIRTA